MTNMLALLAIGALATWIFGSLIARVAGALIVLESLLRIALADTAREPARYVWLAAGVAIWLLGHWMWAYKHRTWRSGLALKAFSAPGIHHLAPIPTNHRPKRSTTTWPTRHYV